jgi:type VI secretion system secreted protein Hcp
MAADIFAKIGDIKGESMDAKHKDEIEVLSYSWGVNNAGSMGSNSGGGQGKASFQDLTFMHRIDKASSVLMQSCAGGDHHKEAIITHRKQGKGGQVEFLVYKLSDVIITAVQHGGSEPAEYNESVSMQFAKVSVEYKAQKQDGSLDAGVFFKYDIKGNIKL